MSASRSESLTPLTVLVVEDAPADAALILRQLREGGYDCDSLIVDSLAAAAAALESRPWDLVIADFMLPGFRAPDLLELMARRGFHVPVIVVSGTVGEEVAVATIQAGAVDYVMKTNLLRLVPAARRALGEAETRRARARAEEAERGTAEALQAVVRASPLAIIGLDRDGKVMLWTPAAERMLGWREDETIGRTPPHVPIDRAAESSGLLARVLAGEEIRDLETRRQRRDGTLIDVHFSAAPLRDGAGEVIGAVGMLGDITARKRAQEQLSYQALLLESVSDAVVGCDEHWVVTSWNQAAETVYGWTSDEVVGRRVGEVLNTHFVAGTRERFIRTIEASGSWRGEVLQCRNDGAEIVVETITMTVRDGNHRLVGYVSVNRDITEAKRAQDERLRLEEQLRQAQKMEAIGQLAAGIAHDFNNLLTAIQGYGEMLITSLDETDPRRRDAVEVTRAADRAAALTRRLLTFSRREAVEPVVVDPNGLVGELESLLRRTLGETIELRLELDHSIPHILIDPGQLEQVILNLAVNARDAMPKGGVLTIASDVVELPAAVVESLELEPGRYVELTVGDTGIGMTAEVRERASEPFFTTKERGQGTGLGLSTVWGIVSQAGGRLAIASEIGQGTSIAVLFPARAERAGAAPAAAAHESQRAASETVLVVEDDNAVRELTCRLLADEGYSVLAARDAAQALELVGSGQGPIDLLVTDIVLPGMRGNELARRLKLAHPNMRVLAMSGYAGDEFRLGTSDLRVLSKPFSQQALLDAVRETLARSTNPEGASAP